MLNSPLPVHRSVFVALAAIALMAVLLRPVCELWSAHVGGGAAPPAASAPFAHNGDAATQCCANVSDAHRIAPWQALSGGAKAFGGVAPAALVAILTGTAILAWQPRWHRAPPRRPESFYIRSARILR